MILSGPRMARARATLISSWPTCTPSASTSFASSTASFRISGTPYRAQMGFSARAMRTNSAGSWCFSRSCRQVTPAASSSSTTSSSRWPFSQCRSVTAYRRSCFAVMFMVSPPRVCSCVGFIIPRNRPDAHLPLAQSARAALLPVGRGAAGAVIVSRLCRFSHCRIPSGGRASRAGPFAFRRRVMPSAAHCLYGGAAQSRQSA